VDVLTRVNVRSRYFNSVVGAIETNPTFLTDSPKVTYSFLIEETNIPTRQRSVA
jgi:hypothetical protein